MKQHILISTGIYIAYFGSRNRSASILLLAVPQRDSPVCACVTLVIKHSSAFEKLPEVINAYR
jgi:hypothetical protein